jgi:cytochrome c oxidase subunit 1
VFGAVAIAAVGAIHYWWPHVLTRPLREGLARLTALVLLIGVVVLALPDVISGLYDEPANSLYTTADGTVKALNAVSFGGGLLVALAAVLFVANLAISMAKEVEGDTVDPWEGHTLEWTRDPAGVTVSSPSPLLDVREAST